MIDKIRTIFSIPELREKIFYTLAILSVVIVGAHIPIPGGDANALSGAFDRLQDTLFGLFNMFVGGAFEKASLFSLRYSVPSLTAFIISQPFIMSKTALVLVKGLSTPPTEVEEMMLVRIGPGIA